MTSNADCAVNSDRKRRLHSKGVGRNLVSMRRCRRQRLLRRRIKAFRPLFDLHTL